MKNIKTEMRRRQSPKKGFVLKELLVVIAIILILTTWSFKMVKLVLNKARIVSVKAQISQLAMLLEEVKDDTGYYPINLSDLTLASSPYMQNRNWKGPYTNQIPLDPWEHPYFYQIPPTTIFTSPLLPREYGKPETLTFSIDSTSGQATLRIENHGVTACTFWLNGVEIVSPNEFKKHPNPQIIEKTITLTGNDILKVRIRSKPGTYLYFSISGFLPTKDYFILGSYGKDGESGGEGFNADIVWYSNKYPNFQFQQ